MASKETDAGMGVPNERKASIHDEPHFLEVDQQSKESLSLGTIIAGTAHNAPTIFEKKAALINAELDRFGMGRYQVCIWFLTGFGYFLDLMWAQGVGLVASAIYQEMGVPPNKQGQIFSLANAGLAIGAFTWGILADVIGRKWCFNLTCLITSVFGMLLAAPKYNYGAICGIYFLASFGLGGNIPIDATIALEFLPQSRRNLVSLLSLWQPIGVVVASGLAYATAADPKYRCPALAPEGDPPTPGSLSCRDSSLSEGDGCCSVGSNMGWRYLVIILGCMTLAIFFLRYFIFTFHESPKFLLSKGREQEAIDVLHKIAKFNRAPPPVLTVEMLREVEELASTDEQIPASRQVGAGESTKMALQKLVGSLEHLKALFTNKLQAFIFVLLAIAYMGDYWSFNLAGAFLPIILLRNNVDLGTSTTETYRQYIYIYLPGILGAVLALFSVSLPLVGRKWSLVFSAICQGLAMAMYTQVNTSAGYVGLNALEYIMQTFFNAVLYASAPELFDTAYRGSASGMLSCLGRIAGIVAPFAGQEYLASNSSGVLWLGAGGIWLSALTMVFLPVEMRNRQMF